MLIALTVACTAPPMSSVDPATTGPGSTAAQHGAMLDPVGVAPATGALDAGTTPADLAPGNLPDLTGALVSDTPDLLGAPTETSDLAMAGSSDSAHAAADLAQGAADLGHASLDLARAPVDMARPPADLSSLATPDLASPPADLAVLPRLGTHHRCGWLGAGDSAGYQVFAQNAAYFDAIHPDWYAINSDGVTVRPIEGEGDTTVLNAARAHNVQLIPMVAGVEDVTWVRGMISDATKRAAHIKNLVAIAVSKGYVGLDIDYEHLWQAGDNANFTRFMTELATAMHAAGKTISDAAEGLNAPDPSSAWDYVALGKVLDQVHIMGYDYHSVGTHSGPVAPLGWIDAIGMYVASTGNAQKFILGLPNYGTTPTWFCNNSDCAVACGGNYTTTTTEMQSCPFNVDSHYLPGRSPHCNSANGVLYFDDALSLEEKVASAKAHGLGGVTEWTVGGEPAGFFQMVPKYF